jgi:hypothetical protein
MTEPRRPATTRVSTWRLSSLAMSAASFQERLDVAAQAARAAEERHDDAAAGEAWRRYRLVRDGLRDPDQLLAEGIALSNQAIALAKSGRFLA